MNLTRLGTWTVLCTLALATMPSQPAAAQTAPASTQSAPNTVEAPIARPADVASATAIVDAVYEVISAGKGQQRDWNRMRSLFLPGARLIATRKSDDGLVTAHVMSVDEYIHRSEPLLIKDGFFERESHRTEDRFGNIVQVFSTYESRHAANDPQPFQRGINSFQLLFDGHRWWVVTIYWQAEHAGLAIPKEYGG